VRSIQSRLAVLVVAAASLGVFAIAGPASATDVAKSPKVTITGDDLSNYAFSPGTVHVKKGGKVKWNWSSNAPHNVTFKKLGQASDDATSGSYSLKFKQAGTFKYVCTIHGFKGKVVVD
jgi:plastocyanin